MIPKLITALTIFLQFERQTDKNMCPLARSGAVVVVIFIWVLYYYTNEQDGLRDKIDVNDIKLHLQTDVAGQPLVHKMLPRVLKEYREVWKPGPLILAFHGSPGTGKNFVSNILAQKFFILGPESKNFHQFIATKDFPATTNQWQLMKYQQKLRWRLEYMCNPKVDGEAYCLFLSYYESIQRHFLPFVEKRVCCKMYVFDEVDSLPDNLLDSVSSFMSSRFFDQTIFVFLSNVGGSEMLEEIQNYEMQNLTTDQIDHSEIVDIVNDALVKSPPKYNPSIVNQIIPFLPLEREHVAMCIRKEITLRIPFVRERTLIKLTDNVLKELLFQGFQDKYSTKGCKNVVEKVNLVLARDKF